MDDFHFYVHVFVVKKTYMTLICWVEGLNFLMPKFSFQKEYDMQVLYAVKLECQNS